MADLKSVSKREFTTETPNHNETIQISCLMRIADASELMAKNFLQLQYDRDYYKRRYEERDQYLQKEVNANRALRGVITKLKKKIKVAALQEQINN